ncbi:MAG: dienelactone hydrolase family protein, partial [Dehalococcoidia bacterium]|nr:dienelactone hydrolase family protein [Dehalococcoidia bacterium]
MCFPHDARPPITPISGAAVDSEDLVLTSKDGTKFAAFVARSENPSGAGMVILPDVRGLFPFYEELALRFAEEGINAVAFDFFGRTAGVS